MYKLGINLFRNIIWVCIILMLGMFMIIGGGSLVGVGNSSYIDKTALIAPKILVVYIFFTLVVWGIFIFTCFIRKPIEDEYIIKDEISKGNRVIGSFIKLIAIGVVGFQFFLLYSYKENYIKTTLQDLNKIVENSKYKEVLNLKSTEMEGIYAIENYEKERNLSKAKSIFDFSNNVNEILFRNNYDGISMLESSVSIKFEELNESIIDDIYKLSQHIKVDNKFVVSKEKIRECYNLLKTNENAVKDVVIKDGYLNLIILLSKDKSCNITLKNNLGYFNYE